MIKKSFVSDEDNLKVFDYLLDRCTLSRGKLDKIFSNRDVKVNGVRVKGDTLLKQGDIVELYYNEVGYQNYFTIMYEDDNIIVVKKKGNIEVISDDGNLDIVTLLKNNGKNAIAVHRLDRGTEGLVILAKNRESENCLLDGFKNHLIDKNYYAIVKGNPKEEDSLIAYLKKDEKKGFVKVFDEAASGSEKITTNYKTIFKNGEYSLLSVELVSGKTHQIRAHLAHMKLPILGDGKYGEKEGYKRQMLCAYKFKFNFKNNSKLAYLNDKEFEIEVPFVKDFFNGKLK